MGTKVPPHNGKLVSKTRFVTILIFTFNLKTVTHMIASTTFNRKTVVV